MAASCFKATWEQVSALNCDHIASWGAFDGYVGPVDFDDTEPAKLHVEHDTERDTFSAFYVWKGKEDEAGPIRSTVRLERRPCRFGGTRAFFICPGCARRTLRLAVLAGGLLCGTCGKITWGSRRETETRRLVRKANKIALRLGLDYFGDPPKRPPHMRAATYARIMAELEPLKAEINRRVAVRMARAKTPWGHFGSVDAVGALARRPRGASAPSVLDLRAGLLLPICYLCRAERSCSVRNAYATY